MLRIIGILSLIVMFGAFVTGAAADSDGVEALGYGLTLAMMPVSACAWMASIAFPKQGAASQV